MKTTRDLQLYLYKFENKIYLLLSYPQNIYKIWVTEYFIGHMRNLDIENNPHTTGKYFKHFNEIGEPDDTFDQSDFPELIIMSYRINLTHCQNQDVNRQRYYVINSIDRGGAGNEHYPFNMLKLVL